MNQTASISNKPFVCVIVLNYNGKNYLQTCLPSLESQTYSDYSVIVCDNASVDGSVDYVKINFPSITIIENKENFGFAKGNNIAMKFALEKGADYILLLNNDVIAEKDIIEKLVTTAEPDKKIGIVGPRIFDIRNRNLIHEIGMTCDKFGFPAVIKCKKVEDKGNVSEAFYVSGCAMMIKQEVLRKILFFDEAYFMFSEDLDLCWRARLEGYTVIVNKAAKIYHASGGSIVGGTIKNRSYTTNLTRIFLRERNTLRTLIKNYSLGNLIRIMPLYLAILSIECFTWAFLLKPSVCISLFKAIWWNIEVLKDTLNHRQRIQAFRKIGDQEIMKKMIKGYAKLQIFRLVGIPHFKNL
ncbi:MAG: glycosyltransferase family 2 protein [Candidatus Bathyarchaeota archaeon]|nr:glycosyltransferase family 2 protein [Candidatus Bathyarchaeota archaeon]